MTFETCSLSYNNAESIANTGINVQCVEFDELAKFNRTRKRFIHSVRNHSLHESWESGIKVFSTIHAKIARTVCRPSWLIETVLNDWGWEIILSDLEKKAPNIDPKIAEDFMKLKSGLEALSKMEKSPLLGAISERRKENQYTHFILRDIRLWPEVRDNLARELIDPYWEVVKPSSMKNPQRANTMFVFGPPWIISTRREEYLLRSPAVKVINLICCSHEFNGKIQYSLLDENSDIEIHGSRNFIIQKASLEDFEVLNSFNTNQFNFRKQTVSRIWESGKKVSAVPFKLGGDKGTFFTPKSKVWVVLIDSFGESPMCKAVERIEAEDLDAGDMILMTTQGGGNMIPAIADLLIKEANKIREIQQLWKTKLLEEVHNQGMENVERKLTALGAEKACDFNIRNWINPRSLGMENLESDLRAVLKFIDLEEKYEEVTHAITELRRAHQSAGRQLQKKLRDGLADRDLGEVLRKGFLEIREGDGPAQTIYLVEARGTEEEVPLEWEGELKEIDD